MQKEHVLATQQKIEAEFTSVFQQSSLSLQGKSKDLKVELPVDEETTFNLILNIEFFDYNQEVARNAVTTAATSAALLSATLNPKYVIEHPKTIAELYLKSEPVILELLSKLIKETTELFLVDIQEHCLSCDDDNEIAAFAFPLFDTPYQLCALVQNVVFCLMLLKRAGATEQEMSDIAMQTLEHIDFSYFAAHKSSDFLLSLARRLPGYP